MTRTQVQRQRRITARQVEESAAPAPRGPSPTASKLLGSAAALLERLDALVAELG